MNRTWDEILVLLKTTHTLSIRIICKYLKVERSWVNTYISPYLNDDKIYLSKGKGDSLHATFTDWVLLASIMLDSDYIKDSIWYNEDKFNKLILSSIGSITKQTKQIPVELLVKDKGNYLKAYEEKTYEIEQLKKELLSGTDRKKVAYLKKAMAERKKLHESMLSTTGASILSEGMVSEYSRNDVGPVDYELDRILDYHRWIPAHEMVEYGDTRESLYRKLFKEGWIRLELNIRDSSNTKTSQKIYYIKDDRPLLHQYVDEYVTVSQRVFEKYYSEI